MLLLLLLAHLLTKNSSVAPVAPPAIAPRSLAGTCDDINKCRKLFDIVWGCLATMFACTWVSLHPNVPPPNQSWLALFWRRLKMMLIGIIVPELMVGFAARQFLGAQYGFSRTHGFFLCMGGFVSSAGYPIAWLTQLKDPDLGPEFLKGIQKIRAVEIADKSKGDAFSKGVALAQGLWFTMQCLARMHQHLVITKLEVATLAFAAMNIFIWMLWWGKPLDVQQPMVVGPPRPPDMQPIIFRQRSWQDHFLSIFGMEENDKDDPRLFTSVPTFWSPCMDTNLVFVTVGITALAGSVFGAIHCAAWNTDFPTAAEMYLWRACSLGIAGIPVVVFLLGLLSAIIDHIVFQETTIDTISLIVIIGFFPIYIVARLILIALPLAALRSLPPSTFVDVNWSPVSHAQFDFFRDNWDYENGPSNSNNNRKSPEMPYLTLTTISIWGSRRKYRETSSCAH
ncbi:hypothetical protein MVEN_01415300 [Mycena venus]|uniref:Uncharacterized protein n=1 Tax=Mycena venus TaxID=2733690 RepID=A0A8H6XXG6_9AGAR|nr:hypothetical protein MVEN_01415300 [Mycena venus]